KRLDNVGGTHREHERDLGTLGLHPQPPPDPCADTIIARQRVHLIQKLVELGAATAAKHAAHCAHAHTARAHPGAATANRIDLVDEQNAGAIFLGESARLAVETDDSHGAHAKEHA